MQWQHAPQTENLDVFVVRPSLLVTAFIDSHVCIKHFVSPLKDGLRPRRSVLPLYCRPICAFGLWWHFLKPRNLSGVSWMDGISISDLKKKKRQTLSGIISLLNVNKFKEMSPELESKMWWVVNGGG